MSARDTILAASIEGTLLEIDLEHHSCRIRQLTGGCIECDFKEEHLPIITGLLDAYVVATGQASFREANGHIKRLQIRNIRLRKRPNQAALTQVAGKKQMTAKALLESGLVGIWKHRSDIGSSQEFARGLRERAQVRRRD